MTLVDPSCGQLLLGLLNGLSHLLSSSGSGFHTSRAVAEFHVSDFRHDDYSAIRKVCNFFSFS
jgi:hypothetical protein